MTTLRGGSGQAGSGTDTTGPDDATVFRDDATVLRATTLTDTEPSNSAPDNSWDDREGPQADAPKVLKQRFVLEEKIGSGGMGTVFRAKDLRKVEARDSQPYVAIKILNNDFRKHPEAFIALEREASKSQTLRHTNVVSIFDFDKDADVPFITMELLEGEELADLLRHYPNGLPQDLAWSIIQDMLEGLEHAHKEGVVHADFKPGNIFITHESRAKVLDFGIARAVRTNQSGEDTDFDPARLAALTPAYASREMLNGDNPEPRDDLYSLGVVMYMVLSGRHPFGRLPATDAAKEGLVPERPKGVTRKQWRVLKKCLDFNRQGRPIDAAAVKELLFAKRTWQRMALAASVGVLGIATIVVATYEPADISEVRHEVRQETLVEAQAERISMLLDTPIFDEVWPRRVLAELDTLRHLDVLHPANQELLRETETIFNNYLKTHASMDEAVVLYRATQQHGQMALIEEQLILRLRSDIASLADETIDTAWLSEATRQLAVIDELFPNNEELNAVRVGLAERVRTELPRLLANQTEIASEAWTLVENDVTDAEIRQAADEEVAKAVLASETEQAQRDFSQARKRSLVELEPLLNVSCLRLDLEKIDRQLSRTLDAHRAAGRKVVGQRLGECHSRLLTLDASEADRLARSARNIMGGINWHSGQGDPCAASYLLGNGRAEDRAGFCLDRFATNGVDVKGPKLVVIPAQNDQQKLAISKYEISWRQFALFCQGREQCPSDRQDDLPVTDLNVELIEAYAVWLSERTGFEYRLPTLAEWSELAVGEPDPNRNCVLQAGTLRRGNAPLAVNQGQSNPLGLVHIFGNAREIVRDKEGYAVVGGGYNDPIDTCGANSRAVLTSDAQTGFRLVREVS